MMKQAFEIEAGEMLRPTRSSFAGVYYTLHPREPKLLIDRLQLKAQVLDSRDVWLLSRLRAGWIPLYRVTRKPGGVETKEITAAPQDYTFRVISNKPARRPARQKTTTQTSLF